MYFPSLLHMIQQCPELQPTREERIIEMKKRTVSDGVHCMNMYCIIIYTWREGVRVGRRGGKEEVGRRREEEERGREGEGEVYLVFQESIGSCFEKGLCSIYVPSLSCKVESRPSSAL